MTDTTIIILIFLVSLVPILIARSFVFRARNKFDNYLRKKHKEKWIEIKSLSSSQSFFSSVFTPESKKNILDKKHYKDIDDIELERLRYNAARLTYGVPAVFIILFIVLKLFTELK